MSCGAPLRHPVPPTVNETTTTPSSLVYFHGAWGAAERGAVEGALASVTPPHVYESWNQRLGHLWVAILHADRSLTVRQGIEHVSGPDVDVVIRDLASRRWRFGWRY